MKLIIGAFLVGFVHCQSNNELDLSGIEKNLSDIPGLENFNKSAVPAVEDLEKSLKEKCVKNGGEGAYERLELQKTALTECFQRHLNFTAMEEEMKEAKKTGSLDEVFAKPCNKTPEMMDCVKNMTGTAEQCLEENEKANLAIILNVTESLANFVCYKDGDRIAMFIAEQGLECLQERKEALEVCANETLGHRVPKELDPSNLPLLLIESEECSDFEKLQKCAVEELEKCSENTPANIVDALFKFIKRVTPCKNYMSEANIAASRKSDDGTSSSTTTTFNSFLSLFSLLLFVFRRLY